MADDDSGDPKTTKATRLQVATAWVLGLAGLVAAISVLVTNSENLLAIFSPSKQPSEGMSPFVAQSGHRSMSVLCLLSGVKQTSSDAT
jgi:hypothetical protein